MRVMSSKKILALPRRLLMMARVRGEPTLAINGKFVSWARGVYGRGTTVRAVDRSKQRRVVLHSASLRGMVCPSMPPTTGGKSAIRTSPGHHCPREPGSRRKKHHSPPPGDSICRRRAMALRQSGQRRHPPRIQTPTRQSAEMIMPCSKSNIRNVQSEIKRGVVPTSTPPGK
jgi:hypothetical protein